MTTPTNPHHYLALTVAGKQIRARIIYVQRKAERYQPHVANMDIVSSDWIEQEWHPASFTFAIGGQTFRGRYRPLSYKVGEDGYTYYGIFELEQADAAAVAPKGHPTRPV
jgi:hypothetical protein